MAYSIRQATVIGAGTMGAGIAAHLANAGVSVYLLDIVPTELTEREKSRGLDLKNPAVRNRLAREGLARIKANKAAGFYLPNLSERVSIGNIEDNFEWVSVSDWVIEAVVEDMGIKQVLMERIDEIRTPGSIITTNTSGLPIDALASGRSVDFRYHFFGTHFFNPPRVMKLLEVIPGYETDAAVMDFVIRFCEEALGKGVVICKDTPNFIANRIAAIQRSFDMEYVLEGGYTVEEADAVLGPLIGRPKTALFRLGDLVGIDVSTKVGKNLYDLIPHDEFRDFLVGPQSNQVREKMISGGMLGRKSGGGFYKRVKAPTGGPAGIQFWGVDFETLEYREPITPDFARLEQAAQIKNLAERIYFLIEEDDRVGRLAWASLKNVLLYAAYTVPEISDNLISVDRAMRWGYSWEMGPFELWDALGVDRIVERIEAEGEGISDWVKGLIDGESRRFYSLENGRKIQYSPVAEEYQLVPDDPRILPASWLQMESGAYIEISPEARLFDLKDGVAYLQIDKDFPGNGNTALDVFDSALSKVEADFKGLVVSKLENITTAGISIPVLSELIRERDIDAIGNSIDRMKGLQSLIQTFHKPIVFAGIGRVTGAEALIGLSAASISVDAESLLGFEETAFGLLPVAGGCKELMRRAFEPLNRSPALDPLQFLRRLFDLIGYAKVSNNAIEARESGFLSEHDDIVMNRDHVARRAKDRVISLAAVGVQASPIERSIFVLGERGKAALGASVHLLHESGFVTDYDKFIANKLIHILSGGDLTSPQWVDEKYIMELEREAFLSLCGEEKTLARLEHIVKTGKKLRN